MVDTPAITITGGGIAGQASGPGFRAGGIEVCLIGEQDDQAPAGVQLARTPGRHLRCWGSTIRPGHRPSRCG